MSEFWQGFSAGVAVLVAPAAWAIRRYLNEERSLREQRRKLRGGAPVEPMRFGVWARSTCQAVTNIRKQEA